jgi:dTDP-4-dehydrorhamnose reductase
MQKLLIFGASGQLGVALAARYSGEVEVTSLTHAAVDIGNADQVERAITDAAAYNAVERAGEEIDQAYHVNAFGPYLIARTAALKDIPFLHVSTDYVFDGVQGEYTESDVPSPLNVYGASKHAGEELVRLAHSQSYIVRTSALFGGTASFVERMLEKKDEVRVVSDQKTVPTYTGDLAEAIHALIEKAAPFGIYHLVNGGSATWEEFATAIFAAADRSVTVHAISTAESGTHIERPVSTVLKNEKGKVLGIVLPPWQDGLVRYLASRT